MARVRGNPSLESQVFAIGGGDLHARETFAIDTLATEAVGRSRPWALCITAASGDAPASASAFGDIYGDTLKCRTDFLRLTKVGDETDEMITRKLNRAELLY